MQRIAWVVALLAALTASATLAAKIYKWSDAQGQIHYSELPPAGPAAQTADIQVSPGHPRPTPSPPAVIPAAPTDSNTQASAAKQDESDQRAQPLAEEPERLRQQCQTARQNLQFLQAGGSNRRFRDPSGEVVRYTQAQRQAKIAATEHYLEQHCPAQ